MAADKTSILQAQWWQEATTEWWQQDESCHIYILAQMMQQNQCDQALWNQAKAEYSSKSKSTKESLLNDAQSYLSGNLTPNEMNQLKLSSLSNQWASFGMF